MATAADMRVRELHPESWLLIYAGLLRIAGAALLAAFTAILTNFLLRAQFKGAFEVRRIPEKGHVVVCGLGNVGFRVVEELLREGERVVVVERSATCPFITAARRRKAAVIVSDATAADVLKEAHAATAKAVIAATNNELVNVEIALVARDLNPTQRVVLRLHEAQLAQSLRETTHIRLAVSIPDLAAPAFVAALFGDQVPCVFFVEGHLLAVVNLIADTPESRLLGRPVADLAAEYHLQPICVTPAGGSPVKRPASEPLALGDRLTVIVELADLQRMLQQGAAAVVGAK
jgi:Trk K+ transport system NAD-binding subunit